MGAKLAASAGSEPRIYRIFLRTSEAVGLFLPEAYICMLHTPGIYQIAVGTFESNPGLDLPVLWLPEA